MKRSASAIWNGGLKDGRGSITTDSTVLSHTQYSFSTRFENGVGTNPEELIAAAHAGCFAMALSAQLGAAGITADQIDVKATITLEKLEGGFTITRAVPPRAARPSTPASTLRRVTRDGRTVSDSARFWSGAALMTHRSVRRNPELPLNRRNCRVDPRRGWFSGIV